MEEQVPQYTNNPPANRSGGSKFLIPFVVVIIALGIIAFMMRGRQTQNATTEPTPEAVTPENTDTTTTQETQEPQQQTTDSLYKDGTYETIGNYVSPGGAEELGVTITLKDGVITDAEVDPKGTRPNTVQFQGRFVSGYKPLVIGKNIDEVQLTKVSGSSLAPGGFNEALEEIKQQASS